MPKRAGTGEHVKDPLPLAGLAALAVLLCTASAESAEGPSMIADGEPAAARVEASFESFAAAWMDRALARSRRDSQAPRAQQGASGLRFIYRAVDDSFETELRATGRPSAPYVGVLHYTEHTYTCDDVRASRCRVSSSLPVTEVFRYRDGEWSY